MSCPVAQARVEDRPASSVVAGYERVVGSVFSGLFSAALFDQAMLPAVSAALEATGRVADRPWQRAIRTAVSEQLLVFGNEAERQAEAERLRRLHRDVRGVGSVGVRYSALDPQSWNWIMISTFFAQRAAYLAVTGDDLSAADNQAIWEWFRSMVEPLQLPGRSRLVEDYEQVAVYYDTMVADALTTTPTLRAATARVLHAPRPSFVPRAAQPVWTLLAPLLGEVVAVLGFGSMDPDVRALVPMRWTRRHEVEYRALTTLVQVAYRRLPQRLTDTPLARNRHQYERLTARYHSAGLTSFAP
jgi:uncharacterized protein (DUF2236 family)